MNTAELLNECGTKISAVNDHGVEALASADPTTAAAVRKMLDAASKAGLALQAVADAVLPRKGVQRADEAPPELPPREVPGAAPDDPVYTGTIDPGAMTHTDWAFYFRHFLEAKQAQIFVSKPVYRDLATGRTYINRDADFRNPDGSLLDLSGYAGPLKPFA